MSTLLLFFINFAFAKTVTESFTDRTYFVSGSLNWNQGLHVLQPTAEVQTINTGAAQPPQTLDFSDGSHGSFDSTRFSYFSSNIDTTNKIIVIDTATFPILKVTSFNLPAGWTLRGSGSAALKIFSQSDVIINGTIDCSGDDGTAAGVGGTARCGGGNGGNGGDIGGNGTPGTTPIAPITGGGGGTAGVGVGSGGGGGGSFSDATGAMVAGSNGSGVAGSGGSYTAADVIYQTEKGGAGGGGGSGGNTTVGGGGGAGGGFIEIHAGRNVTVGTNGKVLAKGGNGGSPASNGGPGGAGGGGTIKIWAATAVTVNNNVDTYAFNSAAGVRGTVGVVNGGNAYDGRNWIDLGNFSTPGGATYYPNEPAYFVTIGVVRYITTAQTVTSAPYDVGSTLATPVSFVTVPASADWTIQVAGSNDSFLSDDTGYLAVGQISQLTNKRYMRFKLTLLNSSAVAPTQATSIVYTFNAGTRNDFVLKNAGCGTISKIDSDKNKPWEILILLLPLFLLIYLKLKISAKTNIKFSIG
jgi:hypothetical protein